MYHIYCQGYERSDGFKTLKEAKKNAQELVNELTQQCRNRYGKATKVGSISKDGDCIIKIGGRQAYNWYSRVTVS